MSQPTRTYLLVEERLGEPLAAFVERRRDEKASWSTICYDLASRTDIRLSTETLRLWFVDEPSVVAS